MMLIFLKVALILTSTSDALAYILEKFRKEDRNAWGFAIGIIARLLILIFIGKAVF
jgi:hypothetical protein